jgi:hypothetical protein
MPATLTLDKTEYTVGQLVKMTYSGMPDTAPTVQGYWDGMYCCSPGGIDSYGNGYGGIYVPAAPMGTHTVKIYRAGRSASAMLTIKPRIKVIPNSALIRGQTVNISLRGYAAHETVNIRWIKNGSFVKVASVAMSSTGSANVNVKVPAWVPNGYTSVRGDGSFGHAQTNAVTVVGGPFASSTAKPAPTATPAETTTVEPTSTAVPETPTVEPTVTVSPTVEPSTPEATETSTPLPTETPEVVPTDATDVPTETPAAEPTAVPSETPAIPAEETT